MFTLNIFHFFFGTEPLGSATNKIGGSQRRQLNFVWMLLLRVAYKQNWWEPTATAQFCLELFQDKEEEGGLKGGRRTKSIYELYGSLVLSIYINIMSLY